MEVSTALDGKYSYSQSGDGGKSGGGCPATEGMTQLGHFLRLRLITAYWLDTALATTSQISTIQAGDQPAKQAAAFVSNDYEEFLLNMLTLRIKYRCQLLQLGV